MGINQLIAQKIHTLPPEKQYEVLDFVEFLASRLNPPPETRPRFPSLRPFRAALAPAKTSAAELISKMRDEEDGRF
jgi:hypothetical protein